MKKTLLYTAVFVTFIIPSVTFAAWYNPLSWFKKAPISVTVPVESDITATSDIVTQPSVPTPPKSSITTNITVSDPKLQSQINALVQENAKLQAQLYSLNVQYFALQKENATLTVQNTSLNNQLANKPTQTYIVQTPAPTQTPTTTTMDDSQNQVTEPTQVPFDTPFAWATVGGDSTSLGAAIYNAQMGGLVSFTIDGVTKTATIDHQNGNNPTYWGKTFFTDLTPNTKYDYTLRLDQGDKYAIKTGSITTIAQ